jgi:predicted dehydrogenase
MTNSDNSNRRDFLKKSAAVTAASSLVVPHVHAANDDTLKVALIGCGGRGTGAARQALLADKNVKLTVMADMFEDRLQKSLGAISEIKEVKDKIDVPKERQFVGWDAYKQAIATDVDVVLLTTPPQFRPLHLKAAIDAAKHVFAEKPVAVDGPGVRSVLKTCEEAKKKGLSVVSGLCIRYDKGFQITIDRLHNGEIGDIHTMLANDYRGPIWTKPRQPDWTEMHWQMRNWYYCTWLSGDFNVEQHVHYLDVCAWTLGGYPEKALGLGGRQVRTGEIFGNIYDHHSVTYTYKNGARVFSNCRQIRGCKNDMSAHAVGTNGKSTVAEKRLDITTDATWVYREKHKNMYEVEHDELFRSIRESKPINNGEYMAYSTLMAIMGRMATYTGQEVTWEQALNSREDLTPPVYGWGDNVPELPIAKPGITRLV